MGTPKHRTIALRWAGLAVGMVLLLLPAGCPRLTKDCGCAPTAYNPEIDPANFVSGVDNPYFPLVPGTRYVYEAQTDDGIERVEVTVLRQKKKVMGVACTVVRDTVTLDNEVIEDTYDWFAQDKQGNVWYMGEASMEWDKDMVVSTFGSWEGGIDCAKPGIIMKAEPAVGDTYRQEYYPCIAEDMGIVLELDASYTTPYGSFDHCLVTEDFTPLDPEAVEQKVYAPGVGHILTLEGDERAEELISVSSN